MTSDWAQQYSPESNRITIGGRGSIPPPATLPFQTKTPLTKNFENSYARNTLTRISRAKYPHARNTLTREIPSRAKNFEIF